MHKKKIKYLPRPLKKHRFAKYLCFLWQINILSNENHSEKVPATADYAIYQ